MFICLTPAERERLAALYPPDPLPEPKAPEMPRRTHPPQLVHRGARPDIQGEHHGMAVLTKELVATLRRGALGGKTHRALAEAHGLHETTVNHAVRGDCWGWFRDPPPVAIDRARCTTDAIRKVMRSNVLAEFRVSQLGLNVRSDRIRAALHHLAKRGEVEHTGRGLYRWASATASGCQDASQS